MYFYITKEESKEIATNYANSFADKDKDNKLWLECYQEMVDTISKKLNYSLKEKRHV